MSPPTASSPSRKRPSLLKRLVDLAVRALYRSVDVYAPPDLVPGGPTIVIANHFGGFADALVLISALDDVPRILASSRIWKIPIVRWLMNAIRAIPVQNRRGPGGARSHEEMFRAAYDALAAGDTILIFPEGVTVDDPSIARLKTGAARIALGARARGVEDIRIVPIGIHYEDKAALRSRVSVIIGEPMPLDGELLDDRIDDAVATPDNHELVRALTATMEERLRNVAPNFADWKEAADLTFAAEVAIRAERDDPLPPISTADRDRLAGRLAGVETAQRRRVLDAAARYRRDLEAVGMSDRQTYAQMETGAFLWHLVKTVLLGLVLTPFALVGIATGLVPLLVIGGIGLLPVSPAVKATLKPVAAIVLFPLAWGLAAWKVVNEHFGLVWTIISVVLIPLYLVAAIVMSERIVLLWRAFRAWTGRKGPAEARARLVDDRARVVASVRAVT